jgi:hypothetical protein
MIAFIILLVINIWIFMSMNGSAAPGKKSKGGWTVYGTMGCGWTRKQLDHMKKNGVAHTFVDCDKDGGACGGMEAFPTLVDANGEKTVGYKEV